MRIGRIVSFLWESETLGKWIQASQDEHRRCTTSWNSKISCDARKHCQIPRYPFGQKASENALVGRGHRHINWPGAFHFVSRIKHEKTVGTMGTAFAHSRAEPKSHTNICPMFATLSAKFSWFFVTFCNNGRILGPPLYAGKVMASVFWDLKRILLIDYLKKDKIIIG